jgi:hypothetical protein
MKHKPISVTLDESDMAKVFEYVRQGYEAIQQASVLTAAGAVIDRELLARWHAARLACEDDHAFARAHQTGSDQNLFRAFIRVSRDVTAQALGVQ